MMTMVKAEKSYRSYLELLERQEGVLLYLLNLVVGQIEHPDVCRLFKDFGSETADAVARESKSVEGGEAGEGGRMDIADL